VPLHAFLMHHDQSHPLDRGLLPRYVPGEQERLRVLLVVSCLEHRLLQQSVLKEQLVGYTHSFCRVAGLLHQITREYSGLHQVVQLHSGSQEPNHQRVGRTTSDTMVVPLSKMMIDPR